MRPPDAAEASSGRALEHHVLACVDRSALADVCLRSALSLASALTSELTLVHVMQPPQERAAQHTDALAWEVSRQDAQAYLETLRQRASQALGRAVGVRLEQGHPAERILDLAREVHADITVLGSHGESGVTAWNLGTTVRQVLAASRGSVFVAHPSSDAPIAVPPRRIVVPLDGSQRAECVLSAAARLASASRAEVILVHVVQEPLPTKVLRSAEDLELARDLASRLELGARAYLSGLQAALARDGASVRTLVLRHSSQRQGVLEAARREDADLIVVAAHGAACRATARPFGSVTEHLLTHSEVPVLALQDLPEDLLQPIDVLAPPLRASYPSERP